MSRRRHALPLASLLAGALLAGCAVVEQGDGGTSRPATASEPRSSATAPSTPGRSTAARQPEPSARDTPTPDPRRTPEPRRSYLTIPQLGLRDFPVVRYGGSPDDGPGTEIQNSGPMASPRGPRGGVGPGQVGNFIVTGHRTSHTEPFRDLPSLQPGDRVRVRSGRTVFVYEVTRTRWTSFRSRESLAAQSAAVPGRPGKEPVRPMITLSTCATPEDHAAGNYWSDEFGNPEHRIDKIGVLVAERSAPA